MNLVSNIVVFSIIWWTILFMVLPWGVKVDPHPEKGMDSSAPINPMIGKKLLITTGITTVLWLVSMYIIEQGFLSLF